jgi:hypothetical protein
LNVSITASATAMGDQASQDPSDFVTSYAIDAAEINVTLSTSGPVRSGYLGLSFPQFGSVPTLGTSDGWSNTATLSIGNFQASCFNSSAVEYCTAPDLYVLDSGATALVPFTLGQTFALDFTLRNEAYSGLISGFASGGFAGTVEVRLFEADGVTPVPLYDVPEPGTFALIGFGFAAALSLGRRHSRQ